VLSDLPLTLSTAWLRPLPVEMRSTTYFTYRADSR
jgi:hypothetical protein